MKSNQAEYAVRMICQVLGVSPSGYYAWTSRGPSAREVSDAVLTQRIREIHKDSRETYGVPRVHFELAVEGVRVGRKRVARLMRAAGLAGISRRRWIRTTVRSAGASAAPDLVDRDFTAPAPDRLWVADITYIPTWAGFL
ncbi:MAG: IS3 family transposase, partial [Acidobacteriota bacterium]